MEIKIFINYRMALISTMVAMGDFALEGKSPRWSKKLFRKVVSDYVLMYGESSLDDHADEFNEFNEAAERVAKKYFQDERRRQ